MGGPWGAQGAQRPQERGNPTVPPSLRTIAFFTAVTASHGALDALTNGGLGVAFFSPLVMRRYFFPFRPIAVSPIRAGDFFGERALRILASEVQWVWIPTLVLLLLVWLTRRATRR